MTDKNQEVELLPCPFCGSQDLMLDSLGDSDDWFVSCNGCEIQQIANYTREIAIERWNKRATLSHPIPHSSDWILCPERLPAQHSTVLFYTNEGMTEMGMLSGEDWICERTAPQDEPIVYDVDSERVTHWRELPPAPSSKEPK